MQCKYCNCNNNDNASFCSNCGSIIEGQNSNIFARLFKNLWKGIINPASFIRNSKISDLATTGILLGLTMLVSLINILLVRVKINSILGSVTGIFSKIEKLIGSYSSEINLGILKLGILIVMLPIVLVVCYGLSIFVFSKITKTSSKIIDIANLVVYANFFYGLIAFLATLALLVSLTYVSIIIVLCGIIFFLLLLTQGIKNIIKMNNIITLSSVICGILVYLVVIKVILSIVY